MSRKDNYSVIEDIRTWSGCIRFHYNEQVIAKADRRLFAYCLTLQACLIMDLLPSEEGAIRAYSSFVKNRTDIDIVLFGRFLKKVDGVVKNYLLDFELGSRWTYTRFKRECSCDVDYWDFIGPIKGLLETYLQQPAVREFSLLNQYLNFISRTNIKSLDLKSSMEKEYLELESDMSTWSYPEDIIEGLATILDEWCETFDATVFVPKHGPGSIAGRTGRPCAYEKYTSTELDKRIFDLDVIIGPVGTLFPCVKGPTLYGLSRMSELVCVPKSLVTNRTISKEPSSLQYLQQGVMAAMVTMIRKGPARNHIDFERQELSRDLAREGSMWGEYATIDLSSASDTVTVQLVNRVIRNQQLSILLNATRSVCTKLPSGRVLQLSKFAPMGSSVCFPTETLIFAACCELAARRVPGRKRYYRVYGDDIVIDSRLVDSLYEILGLLHFKINKSKSFSGSTQLNFREACGGEYLNYSDVSPLRVPRKFNLVQSLRWSDADVVDKYVSFANTAFDFGYMNTRGLILQELDRLLGTLPTGKISIRDLAFDTEGLIGLKTYEDSCSNFGKPKRWNPRLHRCEYKCIVCRSNEDDIPDEQYVEEASVDAIRLFEWLRRHVPNSESVMVTHSRNFWDSSPSKLADERVSVNPSRSKISYKWICL